jgi:5-methylthioribose kinase
VEYLAQSLFMTSDLALPAGEKKALTAIFSGNTELCKITEDLVFTDPYRIAKLNRWTAPQLDGIAAEFRADVALKLAASRLKYKFLTSAEALIHGDLHTGSVMVTESDSRIIDPAFELVGPLGFDVGAVLCNLLLSVFSQDLAGGGEGDSAPITRRILDTLESSGTDLPPASGTLAGKPPRAMPSRAISSPRDGCRRARKRAPGDDGLALCRQQPLLGRQDDPRILPGPYVDLEKIADPDRRAPRDPRCASPAS